MEKSSAEITLGEEAVDLDGLNYLAGKTVDFVNKSAMNGTILAHTDGQVPNLRIDIPEQNEFYLGQLFYFFEFGCGVSGYLLGVNPSISRVWRATRRICSRCLENRGMRRKEKSFKRL